MATTEMNLVPLQHAAVFLGVHPRTIRRRIADGTITAYRFGPRLLRVDIDEVEAALRPVPTAGSAA